MNKHIWSEKSDLCLKCFRSRDPNYCLENWRIDPNSECMFSDAEHYLGEIHKWTQEISELKDQIKEIEEYIEENKKKLKEL